MRVENVKVDLKQYITNGFVRSGVSYIGYGIILSFVTLGIGYGTWLLHQKNTLSLSLDISQLFEYLLLIVVGILILNCLFLYYKGGKSFRQFFTFMKSNNVVLLSKQEPMSIVIALDYLNDELIIYENRSLVITEKYIIVLEGEPCIKPKALIKSVSQDVKNLATGRGIRLNQLKTIKLEFKNKEIKKVNCHYIQEANEILNVMKNDHIKVI